MAREQTENTVRKAAIWIGMAAGFFLIWWLRPAILLAFGAALLAILLDLITEAICRTCRFARGWAFAIAIAVVIGLLIVCIWLFGTNLSQQFRQVMQRVSTGEKSFSAMLGTGSFGQSLASSGNSFFSSMVQSVVSTGTELIEGAVIMLIAAIYLAARPERHLEGAADFFPPESRPHFLRVMDAVGIVLQEWILGQLVLMVTVGVLSTIAVWLIGLPGPLALGVIAGLTEAIPYLGPWIGAIPSLLVALTVSNSFEPVILTAGAYLGVHMFEGYVIGPLIQRWFAGIPPALMLLGIFAGQLIFGLPGVILGGPMSVAIFAGIKIAYLKQPMEAAEKKIRA